MFQTLTPHVRQPRGRLKMKQELQTEICLAVLQNIVALESSSILYHSSHSHQTFVRAQYPTALLQQNKQNIIHNAQPLILHKWCHCSASNSERRLQGTAKASSPAIQ
jgi:hypothetical protein